MTTPLQRVRDADALASEFESYEPLLERAGLTRAELHEAASERVIEWLHRVAGSEQQEFLVVLCALWIDGFLMGAQRDD